ncbi:family 78 glycoside hydrolase catalytic domain [Roseivirga pacifica]|uniref:family 78 glycoside hydrolase catalytic domain n=1 Tax=Roseivirga pacifica TaxID=1267423 RepID=UPI003BB21CB5
MKHHNLIRYVLAACLVLTMFGCSAPSTDISNLRVQYNEAPLAIEDQNPVFGWQMESKTIGQHQTAYRLLVKNTDSNNTVWDSKKTNSGLSQGIVYKGAPLTPETAYSWELTVWDADDKTHTKKSTFETGLMNPSLNAWDGAQFIGSNDIILDATSAIVFEINTDFQIMKGSTASLVLGADDFRFNNSFLNLENSAGENYVRVELDISGVGTSEGAKLHIYRVGYLEGDRADKPLKTISRKNFPETNINKLITPANKNQVHNLGIYVEASNILIEIDGKTLRTVAQSTGRGGSGFFTGAEGAYIDRLAFHTVNPQGGGNNYVSYPNLNSVGFASRPNSEVNFSNYRILHKGRSDQSNNIAFDANTGNGYSIFEGFNGIKTNAETITVSNSTNHLSVAYADPSHGALTMVRGEFATASKGIKKAKLYATSMGSNELFINGKRVGEDWFGPGATQFRETLGYLTYDVTDLVNEGENAMGAILNPGWYTGYMTFTPANLNFFGDTEALLTKLVITYNDGTTETVVTDPSNWKVFKEGPIEYGSFFQGERYNANREASISVDGNINGWSTAAYDDSAWKPAEAIQPREWIDFDIMARYDQPVRVAETLTAQQVMEIHSAEETTYTYDMGVNMVGVPSITIPAGWLNEGDEVVIRYGEQLYPGLEGDKEEYVNLYGYNGEGKGIAGRILTETYRAAMSTDFYTAKNSEEVVIKPTTTFRGYQFIEITIPGHKGSLPLENVKGIVLSSDKLQSGTYHATTSDNTTGQLVNQLFTNIQRSQLGNFFTIPTDCPQRNERMGWTGDAQAYTRTATYNSDVRNFFRQWMVALRNDQGVGSETDVAGGIGSTVPTFNMADETQFADGTTWAAAVCQVPWQLYNQYGDTQIIEENIETMMLWLNGMHHYNFSDEYTYLSAKTTGLSDWLAMDSHTPAQMVNNAIYIRMMEVTAIMAEAIGRDDYATTLRERHAKAKAEWNEVYVDPASGRTKDADGTIIHSQTSYATPLNFNAFSEENKPKAQAFLAELTATPANSNTYADGSRVEYPRPAFSFGGSPADPKDFLPYTITTGFSGTPNILPALSRAGNVTDAYNLFSSTDYTSWLYPVTMGATSIWERWNGYEAAFEENNQNFMNSFNHFALGAVGQWMYEYQLGIASDHANGEAGYKHFVLQPQAGGNFTALEGSYESNYGTVKSAWKQNNQGNMSGYKTTVPANTTATLYLPVADSVADFGTGEGVEFVERTTRNNVTVAAYKLSSGAFEFEVSTSGVVVK